MKLPEAHFGDTGNKRNWREDKAVVDDVDPDDEELDETSADIIGMLGFDPLKEKA